MRREELRMNIDNCFKNFYCKVNKISMAVVGEESNILDFLFIFFVLLLFRLGKKQHCRLPMRIILFCQSLLWNVESDLQ